MTLYIGTREVTPSIITNNGGSGSEILCINKTGSTINAGDKVYIAANTNPTLITQNKFITTFSYTGIASENILNNAYGKVSTSMKTPHTGSLEQWDRVDNKATVVGFFTDSNGTKYAVCVADAAYRSGYTNWSKNSVSSGILPSYSNSSSAVNAKESATYNMNILISNYDISTLPAFNACYTQTLIFQNEIYHGVLPNANELQMISNNKSNLDLLDITLSDYPNNSLVTWNMDNNSTNRCWSSTMYNNTAWNLNNSNSWANSTSSYGTKIGIIPIFEIPVLD